MKPSIWTPERLDTLSRGELVQLRANAERLSNEQLVTDCDAALERQPKPSPKRVAAARAPKKSVTDVVVGYHFVCQYDRGVETNGDGTFWSGSWVVAEDNVKNSLKHGAYLALHSSKSEASYRQGKIVDYRKTTRTIDAKTTDALEFKVEPEDSQYEWVGQGAGEKGYKWSKLSSIRNTTDQGEG